MRARAERKTILLSTQQQVSYWGDVSVLQALVADHPAIDLELETNEDAPQTPLDIAQSMPGRGHKAFCTTLQGLLKSANSTSGGGGGGGGSGGVDGGPSRHAPGYQSPEY